VRTLSEFRAHWHPLIVRQAKDVAEKIEAGEDTSRFLQLEPQYRRAFELGYLLHLRLQQAAEFAQFLDFCGLGSAEMGAEDWISLAIDSWREFTVHKWRYEFKRVYPQQKS
jgi:hypothetical protein